MEKIPPRKEYPKKQTSERNFNCQKARDDVQGVAIIPLSRTHYKICMINDDEAFTVCRLRNYKDKSAHGVDHTYGKFNKYGTPWCS